MSLYKSKGINILLDELTYTGNTIYISAYTWTKCTNITGTEQTGWNDTTKDFIAKEDGIYIFQFSFDFGGANGLVGLKKNNNFIAMSQDGAVNNEFLNIALHCKKGDTVNFWVYSGASSGSYGGINYTPWARILAIKG